MEDMQQKRPMDRLVCGDVGFGKTEVRCERPSRPFWMANRRRLLFPQPFWPFQHYHSFRMRFENFPPKIEFLSRFKTPKDSRLIREKIRQGAIDIIIGTHKLLSNQLHFFDLGLVVIDEEHRFGRGPQRETQTLEILRGFFNPHCYSHSQNLTIVPFWVEGSFTYKNASPKTPIHPKSYRKG